ncbi:MAG: hypothetical protein ACM31C_26775 [Acidobacteriota bacterium]
MKSLPILALALVGCLDVPKPAQGMCKATSDCASGEVCQENVCWGDPPAGMFAATLGPPSDRTDLVATELPALMIPSDGWLGMLAMPSPVTLSGRVEAFCSTGQTTCDATSIGATITVTRASLFAGGPGVHAVVTAKDGIPGGTDSFSTRLPAGHAGEPPYVVTVMPDGRGDQPPSSGTSPAMIAPPLRLTVDGLSDTHLPLTLGSASSPTVQGSLSDGQLTPHPLAKYRVVALGRWDATSPLSEVSTVAYVGAVQPSNGTFALTIADGVTGPVEIVATPYDPNVVAPTLYLPNVSPGDAQNVLTQPAALGNRVDLSIPIQGLAGDGSIQPVSGARVIVTGRLDPALGTHAVLSAEATTSGDGIAHVSVLDGEALNGSYKLRVVPPASSPLAAIYDQPLELATAGVPVRLAPRLALRGSVVDSTGAPVSNVSVTVRPSLSFVWALDDDAQQFLAEIPAATAVTPDNGGFVVWVDPFIGTVWGAYDLTLEPPATSPAPTWTRTGIQMPRAPNQMSLAIDQVMIPEAAHLHGEITDSSGTDVIGGELRIFQIQSDLTVCAQAANPPATCVPPAIPMGSGTSDSLGIVRLTLPRP